MDNNTAIQFVPNLINFKARNAVHHEKELEEENEHHCVNLDYPVSNRRKVVEDYIINHIDKESSIH